MDGLHGRDDPKPSKSWNVNGINLLGVLDAPTQLFAVQARVLLEYGFINVERFPVGAVPNGMNAKLEIVLDGESGRFEYVARWLDIEPSAPSMNFLMALTVSLLFP